MKTKFTYLLLVIIAMTMSFTFTSCGDDDDDVTPGNSSIVGVWEVGDQLINGHPGTLRVEFNSNNKGVISGIYTDGTDPGVNKRKRQKSKEKGRKRELMGK